MTFSIKTAIESLLPGVYAGRCRLYGIEYGSVMSIGYNPYYHNHAKSLVNNNKLQ